MHQIRGHCTSQKRAIVDHIVIQFVKRRIKIYLPHTSGSPQTVLFKVGLGVGGTCYVRARTTENHSPRSENNINDLHVSFSWFHYW